MLLPFDVAQRKTFDMCKNAALLLGTINFWGENSAVHVYVRTYIVCPGRDENMRANMRQYGLEHLYLDMLVADSTKCVWRGQELFDAILTDRELLNVRTYTYTHASDI